MKPATIILVEDDPLQAAELIKHLGDKFPCEVELARSVYQFLELLPRLRKDPPRLFIIDVMLPWKHRDDPKEAKRPPEIKLDDDHKGIRCQERLTADKELARTPVILFTELEENGGFGTELRKVSGKVHYLRKERDWRKLDQLIMRFAFPDLRGR